MKDTHGNVLTAADAKRMQRVQTAFDVALGAPYVKAVLSAFGFDAEMMKLGYEGQHTAACIAVMALIREREEEDEEEDEEG